MDFALADFTLKARDLIGCTSTRDFLDVDGNRNNSASFDFVT